MDLKLNHALWRGSDGGYDQGYGSERSPEEEYPPSMMGEPSRRTIAPDADPHDIYPFITPGELPNLCYLVFDCSVILFYL